MYIYTFDKPTFHISPLWLALISITSKISHLVILHIFSCIQLPKMIYHYPRLNLWLLSSDPKLDQPAPSHGVKKMTLIWPF